MVTQIISDLDTDGDGVLSEEEFASIDSSEKDSDKKNEEKKLEFKTAIDANHDGKVRHEMLSTVSTVRLKPRCDSRVTFHCFSSRTCILQDYSVVFKVLCLCLQATLQELILYNDPSNPLHAKREAQQLIQTADVDKDGKLSLKEVLQNAGLFMGSKAVNTAKNIHEEF